MIEGLDAKMAKEQAAAVEVRLQKEIDTSNDQQTQIIKLRHDLGTCESQLSAASATAKELADRTEALTLAAAEAKKDAVRHESLEAELQQQIKAARDELESCAKQAKTKIY